MVPDGFLGSVHLHPVDLPPGMPFQAIGLALGQGLCAVRILVVRSEATPSLTDLWALWRSQSGSHPSALLLAAVHGTSVTLFICRNEGVFRSRCFALLQGEEICHGVLRLPDGAAVWVYLDRKLLAPDQTGGAGESHCSPYASTDDGTTTSAAPPPMPDRIGRYQTVRKLGQGGFGSVYLAYDPEQQVEVAVKVLRDRRLDDRSRERFRQEAVCAAALNHPNILKVFEVGDQNGTLFIAAEYLPGQSLDQVLSSGQLTLTDALRVLSRVADALAYAHQRVIVHCDMKPHNIILDPQSEPHIVDFGLAVRDIEQYERRGERAGTPAYMAPEQVRGEVHRLDGRCDIWALGVMLYEVLTQRKPFGGPHREDLFDEILHRDPRPPRQINPTVPRELERICLKCLSKRMVDRYVSAADLKEDLDHYLQNGDTGAIHSDTLDHIPFRGLRHFEGEDAEVFQKLIPGPRTRQGLPEMVHFWKSRLDSTDPEHAFCVGLLFGPSGSGKTSFLQAGVLPRLNTSVQVVYVEATAQATEARLARALRKIHPALPEHHSLSIQLGHLRSWLSTQPGRKVLIILDQFEQYLHANEPNQQTELVLALRQCDGVSLQGLLSVRDDFWMGVTRLFAVLETQLRIGENAAPLEPMDAAHARTVLAAFGRSLGALPERAEDLTPSQQDFLEQAIEMFHKEGKIISVQLALFTQMMQGRPWEADTLGRLGGSEGLGVEFLEITFSSASADARCCLHARAVRNILGALLPLPGVTIKGHSRSYRELLAVSGYASHPTRFADVLHLLDREMRLITPVEHELPDSKREEGSPTDEQDRHYQLTHDYLIPALRRWIRQEQNRTQQGRTQLLLEERTQLWQAKRENRQLPSLGEWLRISVLGKVQTPVQRELMRATHRYHILRITLFLAMMGILGWLGLEMEASLRSQALIERLLTAQTRNVPAIVEEIGSHRFRIDSQLDAHLATATGRGELHLRLARLPTDDGQVEHLRDWLLEATPEEVGVIRDALSPYRDRLSKYYWSVLELPGPRKSRALRAACVLAAFEPEDPRWPSVAPSLTSMLTSEDLIFAVAWGQLLLPVSKHLLPSLRELVIQYITDEQALIAASLLGKFTADQPDVLCDLIEETHPRYIRIFANRLARLPRGIETLSARLDVKPDASWSVSRMAAVGRSQANVCLALGILGRQEAIRSGCASVQYPDWRSYLIHGLGQAGLDSKPIINQFALDANPLVRQAILLALGCTEKKRFPPQEQAAIARLVKKLATSDPHPGVHSAAIWLLHRWELDQPRFQPKSADKNGFPKRQQWYINSQGQTLVLVQPKGEFLMGGPMNTPRREETDRIQKILIDRSFVISTTEVTLEQFLRFVRDHPGKEIRTDPHSPALLVSWYDAARYCRWLSEQEGIAEEEMCFPPIDQIKDTFQVPENYLERTGYRLPTEAEWEYACRDGTTSVRPFGQGDALLGSYAWYFVNAGNRIHPVGQKMPNSLGLFDMLGNAYEWCFDDLLAYKEQGEGSVKDRIAQTEVNEDQTRVIRGGAYHRGPLSLRPASRQATGIADRHRNVRIGFRIVRTIRLP